jgi:hypothetical protein
VEALGPLRRLHAQRASSGVCRARPGGPPTARTWLEPLAAAYRCAVSNPHVGRLSAAPLKWFSAWPDQDLERGRVGIYAIFCDESFLYAGMSRVDSRDTENPQAGGVWGRLATHSRGTESGRFSVGIRDYYVLPTLTTDLIGAGFNMNAAIRAFVKERCSYRAVVTPSAAEARAAETFARRHGFGAYDLPLFNPLS